MIKRVLIDNHYEISEKLNELIEHVTRLERLAIEPRQEVKDKIINEIKKEYN